MKRYWEYTKSILEHKWLVFMYGLKLGVPIWILILHDWDKFWPDEFFAYAQHIFDPNGNRYDLLQENYKYLPVEDNAFDDAYWRHMKRNKHHWNYWPVKHNEGFYVKDMPLVYRKEMLADWYAVSASKGFSSPRNWYLATKDTMSFHPATKAWIEQQLQI